MTIQKIGKRSGSTTEWFYIQKNGHKAQGPNKLEYPNQLYILLSVRTLTYRPRISINSPSGPLNIARFQRRSW